MPDYQKTIVSWLACGVILLGISFGVSGQSASDAPSFEVASIKPNKSASLAIGLFPSPGRVKINNYTLRILIQDIYGLKNYQVLGGPAWLDTDRYDIEAKAEGNANLAQMNPMIKTLLATRFQLRFHKEIRNLPVYELVVANGGSKLRIPDSSDTKAPNLRIGENLFIGHKVSLKWFSDALAGQLQRPVVDDTKLAGTYNFDLQYTPEGVMPEDPNSAAAVSIFTAIQEQLGLKLLSRKGPVDVIVIDYAEKPPPN